MTAMTAADTILPGPEDVGYEWRREQLAEQAEAPPAICPADYGTIHDQYCQPAPGRTPSR